MDAPEVVDIVDSRPVEVHNSEGGRNYPAEGHIAVAGGIVTYLEDEDQKSNYTRSSKSNTDVNCFKRASTTSHFSIRRGDALLM